MNEIDPPKIQKLAFSTAETAQMLGIDRTSLWRLDKRGLLCPSRALRTPRYSLEAIQTFLRETSK